MKIRKVRKLVPIALFLFALATLSSCNRGMGCPNNFSLSSVVSAAGDQVVELFVQE
ncbi:MAG: hypothetical protein AAF990_24970 [Bacteroidota bacterium]